MGLLVPDVGEVELLKRALYGNASAEAGTLKLFQNNITPAETDTAGTYTEATFTGYAAKTLTSSQSASTWAVPTTDGGGITSSSYGSSPQTWSPTSSQTIYGYTILGATSGILWWAEKFGSAKNLGNGDTLNLTPRMQLD